MIIAIRENERAAQSFSVDVVRAKLTAFVISGFVAGVGGALFVHLNQAFSVTSYDTGESFNVFITAVIGGLGSLGGALLGALYLRGTRWFINDQVWQLLSTGARRAAGAADAARRSRQPVGEAARRRGAACSPVTRVDEAHAIKLDEPEQDAA